VYWGCYYATALEREQNKRSKKKKEVLRSEVKLKGLRRKKKCWEVKSLEPTFLPRFDRSDHGNGGEKEEEKTKFQEQKNFWEVKSLELTVTLLFSPW
jgi:hypothetical protein